MADANTEELDQKSRFNSGGLINIRMHNLWEKAHSSAVAGRYNKWNFYLDRIWLELSGDAKKEQEEEFFALTLKLPPTEEKEKKGFEKAKISEILNKSKQYLALIRKETFLRKLQNKQGKGTAYADDEDDWE